MQFSSEVITLITVLANGVALLLAAYAHSIKRKAESSYKKEVGSLNQSDRFIGMYEKQMSINSTMSVSIEKTYNTLKHIFDGHMQVIQIEIQQNNQSLISINQKLDRIEELILARASSTGGSRSKAKRKTKTAPAKPRRPRQDSFAHEAKSDSV